VLGNFVVSMKDCRPLAKPGLVIGLINNGVFASLSSGSRNRAAVLIFYDNLLHKPYLEALRPDRPVINSLFYLAIKRVFFGLYSKRVIPFYRAPATTVACGFLLLVYF
jgi:hypothetical protein